MLPGNRDCAMSEFPGIQGLNLNYRPFIQTLVLDIHSTGCLTMFRTLLFLF